MVKFVTMESKILYNLNDRIAQYEQWRQDSIQRGIDDPTTPHDDKCYDKWIQDAKDEAFTGNQYTVDAGSPGIGHFVYEITDVKDNGDVMGYCVSDNVRELTEAEVI